MFRREPRRPRFVPIPVGSLDWGLRLNGALTRLDEYLAKLEERVARLEEKG